MINIVRVYDKQQPNTHREYCGRSGKGVIGLLGNPFAANVDHSNRDEVCDKYQEYFHSNIPQRAKELVEIAKTQDIELACFCQSPKDVVKKRCHTETIKAYIEQQLEKYKMRYTPESITELKPNEIFVFGSNTQGRHGKGAAKLAMQFGAIYGIAEGHQGDTYAIITKDLTKSEKFPLRWIKEGIVDFLRDANNTPSFTYLVTKIGCGLGGYTVSEIANLFTGLDIPDNVVLPKEFWNVINNQEESKMKTQIKPIGIIRPVVNQMDCIPSFRNELSFLSNMYEYPINNFKCAEAYYQAHKVAGTEAYTAFLSLNGYEAKRLGKQVELRSDWNEVKLSIMEEVLRAKFQGELLQKLLAVKGEIVERNNWGDSYWGICNGKGQNQLGKLLMKIRDETVKPELKEIPSMTYSGIGSRSTPLDILQQMANIAFELRNDFVLYSGAAPGADKAFSEGTTNKIEFIPWKGFNNCSTGIVAVSNEAMELAATLHPAWDKLSQGAKKLMARNCHQILGEDLNSPVDFVLCWTPDGAETKTGYNTGGTGQAIRLANRYGISVINMFNVDWKQKLDVLLEDIHILNQANQISLSTY